MIRKIITSAFVLSPIFLLAQASPPAQTSPPAEMSSLLQPANSTSPRTDESTSSSSTPVRVSNGVVAPRLIHSANIQWAGDAYPDEKIVVVHFTVDPTGKPVNLSIVSSTSPTMNRSVLQGVKQYRFQPGTLDNSPYSVPMNLQIVVRSPND